MKNLRIMSTSLLRHPPGCSGGSGGENEAEHEGQLIINNYASYSVFPSTGVVGDVYYDESTGDYYYWNGTEYSPIEVTPSGIKEILSFTGASPFVVTWNAARKKIFGSFPIFNTHLSDGSDLSHESIPCMISLTDSKPDSFSFETSGMDGVVVIA